mgnify:CR=1 FL=1
MRLGGATFSWGVSEVPVTGGHEPVGNPFEDGERLELLWYDAVAQRRAVLDRLRTLIGPNLELHRVGDVPSDLLDLHEALSRCTSRCLELGRRWDVARSRQQAAAKTSTPEAPDAV